MTKITQYTTLIPPLLLLFIAHGFAEVGGLPSAISRTGTSPDQVVSMVPTLQFDQAMELLNTLCKKQLGKIIVDPAASQIPIGVTVDNLYWLDALDQILRKNGLTAVETKDYILIKPIDVVTQPGDTKPAPQPADIIDKREVIISTVFFEANLSDINELGTTWQFTHTDGDAAQMTAADAHQGFFEFSGARGLDFGKVSVKLKTLANRQKGKIIASPQIAVQSGKEGRIQIGSDFSVTIKDFAGNALTQFFSTGSIITVTPLVVTEDSVTFIHLSMDVQKSSANNSPLGIEIKKTDARTSLLLLDGEETIIGGLYYTEAGTTREGIPFLKDLPWWVLGLKYIFGYESHSNIRKELIVLIKAELVPSLEERVQERLAQLQEKAPLQRGIEQFDQRLREMETQSSTDRALVK